MKNFKQANGPISWEYVKVGDRFTYKIYNTPTEGKIQKQGEGVYLCQDSYNGAPCWDKLGFKYS